MGEGARSRLSAARAAGVIPAGMLVSSTDPAVTEILARAGYEFAIVDGEHSPMGPMEWLAHTRAAQAAGILAMIRVPENTPALLQKAVELGSQAVVVPQVNTAEEAAAAVAAVRLPPHGNRGRCSSTRAAGFSRQGWQDHIEETRADFLVIPIIESELAMSNIEEILDVDGVDYVHFGPGDLSADLGVPLESSVIGDHYRAALDAAAARGKHVIGVDVVNAPGAPAPGAMLLSADLTHFAQLMTSMRQSAHERFSLQESAP